MNILEGYIKETELAKQFNRSRRTVARWRNQPDGLPYTEVGGEIMYRVDSVREWLASRERHPNPRRSA